MFGDVGRRQGYVLPNLDLGLADVQLSLRQLGLGLANLTSVAVKDGNGNLDLRADERDPRVVEFVKRTD